MRIFKMIFEIMGSLIGGLILGFVIYAETDLQNKNIQCLNQGGSFIDDVGCFDETH